MRILAVFLIVLVMGCASSRSERNQSKEQGRVEPKPAPIDEGTSLMDVPQDDQHADIEQAHPVGLESFWKEVDALRLPDLVRRIEPSDFKAYQCDFTALKLALNGETASLLVPTLAGLKRFNLENASTMNPALASRFPGIKSYKGRSEDGLLSIRLDTNDEGLFVEVSGPQTKELIAPLFTGSPNYYALYLESALPSPTRDASFD